MKPRLAIPIIIILAIIAGFFVYPAVSQKVGFTFPEWFQKDFKFGLDIKGGAHLVYQADLNKISSGEEDEAMEGLKDVIERRVNLFGVSEPVVTINKSGDSWRLIVELAGVMDVNEAINQIGKTPYLEFRKPGTIEATVDDEGNATINQDQQVNFEPTELTGRFLNKASMVFDPQTNEPIVLLEFNDEGSKMFADLTREYVGQPIAIYLDGFILSAPVVQQEIPSGQAQISGRFTVPEARELVQNLNAGALPVPIELISQQTIGATLGEESLNKSMMAGFIGFLLVALFMIFYYRLAGVVAVTALTIYTVLVLSIFKLIPVTLTLAGFVGFILSVGMAVDANILIFERMKEELRKGKEFRPAMEEGFSKAWTAIRDAYTSTIMTAIVLYWFGTSLVRGFALTLALGLIISLLTAVIITKSFVRALASTRLREVKWMWKH